MNLELEEISDHVSQMTLNYFCIFEDMKRHKHHTSTVPSITHGIIGKRVGRKEGEN